ncbi:MAG: hypothetical protein ACM4AI_07680 [Acidobacteriota bacterium]
MGLAVWCAAGRISLAAFDQPSIRLAVPAPWWVAIVAIAAALLVPAWRRRPVLATPALLSTLPWLPLPLPAAALIWTGPLAWVPIGLAAVTALLASAPAISEEEPPVQAASINPRHAARLAAGLTLVLAVATAWQISPRTPDGDEPHYLIITQSLIKDGDLRIENNHRALDYAAYYKYPLAPDMLRRGRDGQIYSIHAPGLPVLVLPAFWLVGYRGAQATVLIVAALCGALIWNLGWRATRSTRAAWFAWAAIAGTVTFLVQGATIFPDGPAALAVAAGLGVLLSLNVHDHAAPISRRTLIASSALLACLPWLHTRFAVLAAGFGLAIVWSITRDRASPRDERVRRLVWFLALPLVSAVAWLGFFQVIYGTPNPSAPYGPRPEASLAFVPGGLAGLLFDQQFGLMAYAPVLAAAALGVVAARQSTARYVVTSTIAIAAVYLVVVATYWMWWAGVPATPARFAAAMLPMFAVPLAIAWERTGALGRSMLAMLLFVSLAITAVLLGVDRGALAWNVRGTAALWLDWLGPVVDLPRGWPSFFWRLSPGNVATEIPFFVHLVGWFAAFAAIGAAVWMSRRFFRVPDSAPIAAAFGVAVGLMAAIQTGWWVDGVSGPNPLRSQLAILDASREGHSVMRIAPFALARVADLGGAMRIRPRESAPPGSPVWATFSSLPAGTYELRVVANRPRQGELSMKIGLAPRPWRTLTVLPLSRQAFVASLPASVAALTIEPDSALKEAGGSVELVPLAIRRGATANALTVVRYGTTDVFFLDDAAFVEEGGFWVQGGRTAEIVLSAGAGRASIPLALGNGASPNHVRLDADGAVQTLALQPDERREVTLPVTTADGVVRLRVSSEAGFRPSEAPIGDQRYLGVRVEIK